MIKWLLIIAAHGYGGAPVVSTEIFDSEALCKTAIVELSKREYGSFLASEASYECVKLEEPK